MHTGLFTAIDTLNAERTTASFEALAGLVIAHFADEEAQGCLSESHLVSSSHSSQHLTSVMSWYCIA